MNAGEAHYNLAAFPAADMAEKDDPDVNAVAVAAHMAAAHTYNSSPYSQDD